MASGKGFPPPFRTRFSIQFTMVALSLLLSSVTLVFSKSIFSGVPWRRPFLAKQVAVPVQKVLFSPRGGSQLTGDTSETGEETEEEVSAGEEENEEEEEDESESFSSTAQEDMDEEEEWGGPSKTRQHTVDSESWFQESQEVDDSESIVGDDEEDTGVNDLDGDLASESSDTVSKGDSLESEESYTELDEVVLSEEAETNEDDLESQESNASVEEDVSSGVDSSQEEEAIFEANEVVADFAEGSADSGEIVNDIDPSQDDEGSSPAELYPEEPEAQPDDTPVVVNGSTESIDCSWEEVQHQDAEKENVFVADEIEEEEVVLPMGGDAEIEIELTQQHSTDDDSTAFVDRMELADAEDEGETTAGGFGDSYALEDEARVPVPVHSPANPAPTAQETPVEDGENQEAQETAVETQESTSESSDPANTKVDDTTRRILQRELNYHRYEVSRMKPEIAAVAVEKRIQRPAEGIPLNWYRDGYGPDRFEKVKKVAGPVLMAAFTGFVLAQRGMIPGVPVPVKRLKEKPSEILEPISTEADLGGITDQDDMDAPETEPEIAPPPAPAESQGFLQKLADTIRNSLVSVFSFPASLFKR